MKYKKGYSGNPSGRPQGAQNKLTKTIREMFIAAFDELQENKTANLIQWAKKNPTEFYKLAALLIPTEIQTDHIFVEQPLFTDIHILPQYENT